MKFITFIRALLSVHRYDISGYDCVPCMIDGHIVLCVHGTTAICD